MMLTHHSSTYVPTGQAAHVLSLVFGRYCASHELFGTYCPGPQPVWGRHCPPSLVVLYVGQARTGVP